MVLNSLINPIWPSVKQYHFSSSASFHDCKSFWSDDNLFLLAEVCVWYEQKCRELSKSCVNTLTPLPVFIDETISRPQCFKNWHYNIFLAVIKLLVGRNSRGVEKQTFFRIPDTKRIYCKLMFSFYANHSR